MLRQGRYTPPVPQKPPFLLAKWHWAHNPPSSPQRAREGRWKPGTGRAGSAATLPRPQAARRAAPPTGAGVWPHGAGWVAGLTKKMPPMTGRQRMLSGQTVARRAGIDR